jgi:hypothetical protein
MAGKILAGKAVLATFGSRAIGQVVAERHKLHAAYP